MVSSPIPIVPGRDRPRRASQPIAVVDRPGRGVRRRRGRVPAVRRPARQPRRQLPRPARRRASLRRRAPRPARAAGPIRSTLNAYFETGFDLPFKLSEEFTKQFPNVTWDIKQDQFTNLMTATPRLLSGDNPPDLIRLPSMVSLVKDGLLKNLDDYATAFGWDKWPAAQLAQNRVAEDGTRGSGSLYAMGLNYSLTGVFYNKELAHADRHDRAADDGRRVRRPAGQGQGRRPAADHAVERHGERRRPRLPAPEPHGGLRADRADQRLDLPEAGRDHRHADQPDGRPASPAVGRGRLLPEGRERDRVHRRQCPFRQGRGRVHVQRRLAERRLRHGPAGQRRLLRLPAGRGRRQRWPPCRRR